MNAPCFHSRYAPRGFILAILLLTLALFIALNPKTFLAPTIYLAFLSTIPFTAILAVGMTLVIVSGQIDLSFPSIMALAGLVFAWLHAATGSGTLAVAGALLSGGAVGLVNGLIVVRLGVPAIIATLGADFLWRGLTLLISDGVARSLISARGTTVHGLLVGRMGGAIPAQALWLLIVAGALGLVYHRHVFGDAVRFVGDNAASAQALGLPVRTVRAGVFVLMGVLAAFTSSLIYLEMGTWWPTQGEGYLLLVFASVFIGGTSVFGGEGTLFGSVIGAIIIGIIEAGIISAGFSGFWTRLIYGVIIVASVSIYALLMRRANRAIA